MTFSVSFVDTIPSPITPPAAIQFTALHWSAMSFGGYDQATVRASGAAAALWQFQRWLRYAVTIRSEGAIVWDGYVHEVQINVGEGDDSALLLCKGWWHTLDWRYYVDENGLLSYEKTETKTSVGWSLTAGNIGFVGVSINRIADMSGRLNELFEGDFIAASGASNGGNNATHTILESTSIEQKGHVSTGISFDAVDDIFDSNSGLGFFEQYDIIQVSGSTSGANDGYYVAGDVSAGHVETTSTFGAAPIGAQAAGPSVTITRGNNVQVNTGLTNEIPGASGSVTLASATKAAQSFTLTEAWLVGEVTLNVGKVGSPADYARCELCSQSGSAPGTVLGTSDVSGADVEDGGGWLSFHFTTPVSLAASTVSVSGKTNTGRPAMMSRTFTCSLRPGYPARCGAV